MTEKRAKRLTAAITAAAVFLIVVLTTVLTVQIVIIKNRKKELDRLTEIEEEYIEKKQQLEDDIELWLEEWKIVEQARLYGYRKNNE